MQLEKLAIVLRPRNLWEATDLGVRIAVHWFKPLYTAWLALTLPVIAVVFVLFWQFSHISGWTLLFIWWLIPLFDRMALFVISRVVFGEIPSFKQCLRFLPYLLTKTHLIRALTFARLSPARALYLPVDVVEGVRGKRARKRRQLITRMNYFSMMIVTFSGLFAQFTLYLGALVFIGTLSSGPTSFSSSWLLYHFMQPTWLTIALYILFMLLLEPIYVAMGFSVYLKRRNELEAWDLELNLRKMDNQYRAKAAKTGHLVSVIAAMLLFFLPSEQTLAVESQNYAERRQQQIQLAPERIKEVLAQPEFGQTVEEIEWKFIDSEEASRQNVRPERESNTAEAGRTFMWGMLGLIIFFIVLLIVRNIGIKWNNKRRQVEIPTDIGGLDIRPGSLPENIVAAVQSLIQQMRYREALSLLYRATLSTLAHNAGVSFKDSDTEQDCLALVQRQSPSHGDYFRQLTHYWLLQAYAEQKPALSDLEQLCRDWPHYFALKERKERS
jgi:hypothetical protein